MKYHKCYSYSIENLEETNVDIVVRALRNVERLSKLIWIRKVNEEELGTDRRAFLMVNHFQMEIVSI